MRINATELEELYSRASEGPWTMDSFEDQDGRGKYDAYAILDGDGKAILDTMNSDAKTIVERDHRWDDQAKADLQLIAKLHEMVPAILDAVTWRDIETMPIGVRCLIGYWEEDGFRKPKWHQCTGTRLSETTILDDEHVGRAVEAFSHWLPLDFDPPARA